MNSATPVDEPAISEDREIMFSRVLDAPRELVWQAWIDPDRIIQWWGPDGFTTTTHETDVRPDGVWRFTMHGPDGRDYPNRIVFEEIVEPERITYRHDDGGEDVEPVSFRQSVTFEPVSGDPGRTRITMRLIFPSTSERDRVAREYDAVAGGIQCVGRLARHVCGQGGTDAREAIALALPTARDLIVARTFAAPRDLVFAALTQPEHLEQWMTGHPDWPMVECRVDLKVGGHLRYVWRNRNSGERMGLSGTFREIAPPERLVYTELFDEDWTGGETLVTTELSERDGQTTVVTTVLYSTTQARDGALKTGMIEGWGATYDRLEQLLTSGAINARA